MTHSLTESRPALERHEKRLNEQYPKGTRLADKYGKVFTVRHIRLHGYHLRNLAEHIEKFVQDPPSGVADNCLNMLARWALILRTLPC